MDPKDAIVGKPAEREVWLAPDWSNYKPITAAQPKGWTRVTVRDTTYADGRVVTHVLDENHQPITAQILDQQTDDDQARRFQQQQRTAQQQTDQAERRRTRTYTGTDPATGRPATVTEYESGPPSYEEIKPPAETPATQRTAREEAEIRANAALPPDQDPRPETNAERAARADATIRQQGQDARQAAADQRAEQANQRAEENQTRQEQQAAAQANKPSYITAQDGTVYEITPGKDPRAIIQGAKPNQIVNAGNGKLLQVGSDGSVRVIYDSPGADVKQDKDGNWVSVGKDAQGNPTITRLPVQGEPKPGAGPPLPQIILGHSQDALRAYQQQLNAEVQAGTMTPAERQNRWNEAVQTATFTYNEASLQQRENETNLNASVNLATNRLSNATSGFNAALSFVSNLNDKLPPGSDLGGKAFAAILGLQLENARRMGAYDNIRPGSQRSVFAEQGPVGSGQSAVGSGVPPPPAPTVPTTPAQPDAAAAQAEADRQQQAAAGAAVPDGAPPPPPSPVPSAPTGNQSVTPPMPAAERPDDVLTIVRKDGRGTPVTVSRQLWNGSPDFQASSSVVNAQPNPRPWPGAGTAPQSQIAPQDEEYAVLAKARQDQPAVAPPPAPEPPPAPVSPDAGGDSDMPAAVLHTQARISPPWRLSPQRIQQMLAAGVPPETIWGVPRRIA